MGLQQTNNIVNITEGEQMIDINMVHTFKKLLDSTSFGSDSVFMLEMIQNTQRAKATVVNIQLEGDMLIITDNGEGCDSPEKVFNISESGFGIGFGEGFTSLYGLHGKIAVRTQDWKATFDVEKICKSENLKKEDLKFKTKKGLEFFKGFEVRVQSEKLYSLGYKIREVIEENCPIIEGIDFYFNGEYIMKRPLLHIENKDGMIHRFENRFCEGVIAPIAHNDYMTESGIKVYFENRYVTTVTRELRDYVGIVSLKPNKVDLKSPDRSDIIRNTKYEKFHESLKKETYNLGLDVLKTEDWELVEKYHSAIQSKLDIKTIVRFLTIDENASFYKKEEDEEEQDIVDDFEPETELNINKFEEGEVYRTREDVKFTSRVRVGTEKREGFDIIKKKDLNKVKISDLKKYKNLIWCSKNELNTYQAVIDEYEYYGITCFIAPSSIYEDALYYLGIKHARDLGEDTLKKEYEIKNAHAKSAKEKRALEVLSMVENFLETGKIFYISDINCMMHVELYEGKKIYKQKLIVEGYSKYPEINLNRKTLMFPPNMNQNVGKETLTKSDVTFLLCNFELITHELAHHMYFTKDNTKEHYERIFEIQRKLARFIHKI